MKKTRFTEEPMVTWFEVAMDDSLLVRGFERLGNLPRDGERFVEGHRTEGYPIRELGSFDEFQHEELRALRLVEAVDRADVGMVE
jgi:hypothetical protein